MGHCGALAVAGGVESHGPLADAAEHIRAAMRHGQVKTLALCAHGDVDAPVGDFGEFALAGLESHRAHDQGGAVGVMDLGVFAFSGDDHACGQRHFKTGGGCLH